jgi:hypothetical protein
MGRTKDAKFWCECSLGFKTEGRRHRHCFVRGHVAVEENPHPPPRRRVSTTPRRAAAGITPHAA